MNHIQDLIDEVQNKISANKVQLKSTRNEELRVMHEGKDAAYGEILRLLSDKRMELTE